MTPDEYRAAGHRLVDWVADFREAIEELPVRSGAIPGQVLAALPSEPPQVPDGLEALISDLETIIVPASTHPQHPRYLAFFPANASLSTALADIVSTGLGQLGITWESSPALTELETVVCDWMRVLYGLSDSWSGTIHDTASTAALVAMICARERALGHPSGGLQAADRPLVVYATGQAHSSVTKAVALSGIGPSNLRQVETDDELAMRPEVLRRMIRADIEGGLVPAAIVATVGTTATTAVDPVADIAAVAADFGAWLHVDAAMAGSVMLLEDYRWMWEGVEAADSISINPHKWMGTALDCSLYFVRDSAELRAVMATNPSYLRSAADGDVIQYRDWGIPLGRRFRALKLWFQLRLDGIDAIRARIRRDLEHARWLAGVVAAEPGWELVTPTNLQTVCVRHRPPGLAAGDVDAHTRAWVAAINDSGEFYLTPAEVDGRWIARISFGAERTEHHHVMRLWERMREAVSGVEPWGVPR